ncbi:actin-like ATPase involved in cell morphogenesis [Rhodococcus sp. 27YEA15]|uniref:Hsp70 family protein n=1 Tax=Rhodococcus sp. 27YEA15 TaxID=3156259 RepID=UPI003C7DD574
MSSSLGISTGSSGVYSALVDNDSTANTPGSVSAQTRFVSADHANTSVGDLVRASIKLMTTQVTDSPVSPRSVGVTYRTSDQLASIKSALGRSSMQVRLIPEPAAVHAYLAETGKVERYETTAQIDIGEQGITVSVVGHTGEVLNSERSEALGGAEIDRALVAFVTENAAGFMGRHTDIELLASRCHVAKEQLSTADHTTVDLPGGRMTITRSQFESIISTDIEHAVSFVRTSIENAPRTVDAVVLIGGGAHIPAVRSAVADTVQLPVVEIDEPETAATKGAALLADSVIALRYPLTGTGRVGSAAKISGALIGALVVGGLVLGYGARELAPSNPPISPAGTGSTTTSHTVREAETVTENTVIPSYDPLPSNDPMPVPVPRSQPYEPQRTYTTPQYTLPPATTTSTPAPTTTEPTPPATTTAPHWPNLPGITLPPPPPWWPTGPETQVPPTSTDNAGGQPSSSSSTIGPVPGTPSQQESAPPTATATGSALVPAP